jgi:hypothetical protein
MVVAPLSVLLLVQSAGRGHAFTNGIPGSKLGTMGKGGIGTTAALSAAASKAITGTLMKIPQGNAAVSAVLSAGTLLFSADQVEASMQCQSANYPGVSCADVSVQNCAQGQSSTSCCNGKHSCDSSDNSAFGCCSCNDEEACQNSPNCMFYDNTCNGKQSCSYMSEGSIVYSGSCNNFGSCFRSSVIVGSNSCNGSRSCQECGCGDQSCVIPNNECNDDNDYGCYPSCPWCSGCKNADGSSCYNTQLTGYATLSNAGIIWQRTLETKKSKQKNQTSKKTPMSCESAKDKIVSYFQGQSVAKLRSKYTSGKVAKSSKKGGQRKRSRDCNIELSWLYEHLEGDDELVQACAELETHTAKLQAYLGKGWTIQNLKCIPEDKNKIN